MQNIDLETLRHSCSHLMASAVLELFPGTILTIGPSTDEGFYYDFDPSTSSGFNISENDFPLIEKKMLELKEKNLDFIRKEISIEEAKKLFAQNPYKIEILNELEKETDKVSIYETGDFIDLCKGPHVEHTKQIGEFKLLSIAGAYWRGSEKNKMLTRIYGTCFPTKEELDNFLWQKQEALKRDHRKIGKDLDLFSIDEYVGAGLILWHPKLSVVREEIELYWRKEHRKRGYEYIYTPHVGLSNLWQTSGHLDFFKDGMYPEMCMEKKGCGEMTSYYVKPMSCPFHVRIYKSRPRSYRELPLRWCELGSVYRYEESGVLHGMLRVRGLTQDDAHIICREDQFIEEVNLVLDFALDINKVFGFDKLKVYLSTRDMKNKSKYVGEERVWQLAEKTLKEILEKRKIDYCLDEGGAKFYGPSIDLKAIDAIGREWQGTTIQLDMNLPTKFGMSYIDSEGKEQTPIMIHRTLLGAMERFVGTLIEQCSGAFPLWLAPVQVKIIPISDKSLDYALKIKKELFENEIRVEIDDRNERMQAKIRDAEMEKIPYMLIVGPKEAEENKVSVRERGEKDQGTMDFSKLLDIIKKQTQDKS
jgi:threonyl-tRNA synthetase